VLCPLHSIRISFFPIVGRTATAYCLTPLPPCLPHYLQNTYLFISYTRGYILVLCPLHSIRISFFPIVGRTTTAYCLTPLPPCLPHYFQNTYLFISYISFSLFNSLLFRGKLRNLKNCYSTTNSNSYRDGIMNRGQEYYELSTKSFQFNKTELSVDLLPTGVDLISVWIFKAWGLVVNDKRQCNNV
jgi:hypothetical protein